jgi:hypothetical protein
MRTMTWRTIATLRARDTQSDIDESDPGGSRTSESETCPGFRVTGVTVTEVTPTTPITLAES